jgi:hypothetical protein
MSLPPNLSVFKLGAYEFIFKEPKYGLLTGKCPASPALQAGSRGTNKNEISFPEAAQKPFILGSKPSGK